jgi:hypothetical protein
MQTSLWVIFVIVAGMVGFLIGVSQPQYVASTAVSANDAYATTQQLASRQYSIAEVDDAFRNRGND